MEKSIESIWKEGFLSKDALVIPKVNDLYNQKSTLLVDKYRRMMRINLIAVAVGSFVVVGGTWLAKMPVLGIIMFFVLNYVVWGNRKVLRELDAIDKNQNSYDYLKSFRAWTKAKVSMNVRMARVYYPLTFLALVAGMWFSNFEGTPTYEILMEDLLAGNPDLPLLFGVPVYALIAIVGICGILVWAGGPIYRWDVRIVYGRVFDKLDEIIADMEELRNDGQE